MKAYICEFNTGAKTLYLGNSGNISTFPRFYRSLRSIINKLSSSFKREIESKQVKIIEIANVELGLHKSSALAMTFEDAKEKLNQRTFAASGNPQAIYKIKDKRTKKFISPSWKSSKNKMGRIFDKAGPVRLYFSNINFAFISNYEVHEVILNDDMTNVVDVLIFDALEFYTRSPACAKRYREFEARNNNLSLNKPFAAYNDAGIRSM
jgi:hypothetical protein